MVLNLFSVDGQVTCYDSLVIGDATSQVQLQAASLIMVRNKSFETAAVDCQQQDGVRDCGGLFAYLGKDPTHIQYHQAKLCEHFASCLSDMIMTEFPSLGARKTGRTAIAPVSCQTIGKRQERMIECTVCMEWFHQTCLSLPTVLFEDTTKHKGWLCTDCKAKRV